MNAVRLSLGLLALIVLSSCSLWNKDSQQELCIAQIGAFDVGSGSTKMKLAKVDTCQNKVLEILDSQSLAVDYKQSLASDKNNQLSPEILEKGAQAILKLKAMGEKRGVYLFRGVATSAFRTASNGEKAVSYLSSKTGIPIQRISQKEEALIGVLGAQSKLNIPPQHLSVWDIGGGSMQFSNYKKEVFQSYLGNLASVSFKNHILEHIQKKDSKKIHSPNPINREHQLQAIKYAKSFARKKIPRAIAERSKETKVIGIGGVHYYSVRKQTGKDSFTIKDIYAALEKRASLTDEQIGGSYSDTEISNLLLVVSFMEALGIHEVTAIKVDLADGILATPNRFLKPSENGQKSTALN